MRSFNSPPTLRSREGTPASATIDAMSAMEVRMNGLHDGESVSRKIRMKNHTIQMKKEAMRCDVEYNRLGGEYVAAKASSDKRKMKVIKLS